jgi:hypothetical protein
MHAKILKLTNGSNGDFCIRCHTPVGMNLGESVFETNIDRHPTSREGITCIVCHRVEQAYGKISGRVFLNDGTLPGPILGPGRPDGRSREIFDEVNRTLIKPNLGESAVHQTVKTFDQLTESAFCGTCHDVNLFNGFRLEEAFSEYKRSPAAGRGVTCQDCHMGVVQGVFSGDPETNYKHEYIAKIGVRDVGEPRKRTSHVFAGPDHSVIHPGFYPHYDRAEEVATIREWLTFDYAAGWGTEEFEDEIEPAREDAGNPTPFPVRWNNIDERFEARDILFEQFELLEWYQTQRLEVLKNGYGLGEIKVKKANKNGIEIGVEVKNLTDGHPVPTGFIAERVVFLYVTFRDENGDLVYQSGDLDPNFDVRDGHSVYVHNGELPMDKDLFSLQSLFVTRNNRGTEREQVLAVNFSPSPLPFIRPSTFGTILTGRPAGARIHKKNLTPLASRWSDYKVSKRQMTGPGTYKGRVRLVAGMVPIHLVNEIKDVGFDYGMSAHEVSLGIRFGVGDLYNVVTGEDVPRSFMIEALENEDYAALEDVYGKTGGHTLIAEESFDIVVN